MRAQLASSLLGVVSQRLLRHKDGRGRVPAFEVMTGTVAIRNLIRDNKMHQAYGVMEASKSYGMITIDRALKDLVDEDLISEEEAMRFAKNPQAVRASKSSDAPTDAFKAGAAGRYRRK